MTVSVTVLNRNLRPNDAAVKQLETDLNDAMASVRLWRERHSDLVNTLRQQEAIEARATQGDIYSLIKVHVHVRHHSLDIAYNLHCIH